MEKKKKIVLLCAIAAVIVVIGVVLCVVLLNIQPSDQDQPADVNTSTVSGGEWLQDPDQQQEEPLEPTAEEGEELTGTSKEDSYSIPMSDLYTFTDPSDINFDTRYVLYGGSSCSMARGLSAQGFSVEGAYEILYTYQGNCTGEYQCYVLSSEADAIGAYNYLSQYYYGDDTHCERHGDVVCIVNDGDYVQKTYIDFYYQQNAISSPTAEAYLGMGFFFNGMSPYHGSATVPSASTGTTQLSGPAGLPSIGSPVPVPPLEPVGTGEENFALKISDRYTFTDPAGLDFDTRYVLYGDGNSSSVAIVNQQGCHVLEMYEVLYVKNGKAVAEYKCYRAADAAGAQQIANLYGGIVTPHDDAAVMYNDQATLEQTIGYIVQFGGMSEATPTAYLQYMMAYEGMVPYQGTTVPEPPAEEKPVDPTPGGDEETPTPGGDDDQPEKPTEGIQLGDSYVFTDPDGMDYDARYVLYGDSSNPFASQNGAEEYYVILYAKDSAPLGEYQCYVMPDETSAAALVEKLGEFYDTSLSQGNVVVVANSGEYVQQTIDLYVQYGMIPEATVEAYYNAMYVSCGMTLTKDTVYPEDLEGIQLGDSYVFADPEGMDYDARYVLYGDSSNPFASQNGAEEYYVILYAKDSAPLGEYQCYVMPDETSAAALVEKLGEFYDTSLSQGNVVVVSNSGEYVQQTIDLYVQYGMISEATVEAYYNAMYVSYGMTLTEDTVYPEEPEGIQLGDSYVFADPDGMDYDARYVLYGDSSNPFASQNGAEEYYVILYAKDSAPLGEYQCYVMPDETSAAALVEKLGEFYDTSLSQGNVVVVSNSGEYVQQTIDLYVQYGMISEATVEAYYNAMYVSCGMTLTEDTVPAAGEVEISTAAVIPYLKDDEL